jgi:hypothetical protein
MVAYLSLNGTVKEFTAMNQFIELLHIARWASSQCAEWSGQQVDAEYHPDVRN